MNFDPSKKKRRKISNVKKFENNSYRLKKINECILNEMKTLCILTPSENHEIFRIFFCFSSIVKNIIYKIIR